ncbi:hypothetical protein GCM10009839_13870 [Catenulispora yoronensis]|uniref:Uncharacterized protein n=1 Tax=Catenulispora yoronensis TaxID=450799 RepID=A0ABN2TTQ3_9ACTN
MNLEGWSVTAASATAVAGAAWTALIRGGRHTRRIMHAVETIERHSIELVPNHGSSLRDQVDRIATEQNRHSQVLDDHTAVLGEVQRTVAQVAAVVAEHAARSSTQN